jgi:Pectinacetylesterase
MPSCRRLSLAATFALTTWTVAGPLAAQPLTQALCPAGSPFNLQPTFTSFLPGQAGIPLLRRTIDVATYPNARCNDGSAAVMYIRPANAAYGGNPIVNPSNKWVIFLDGGGGCHDADECLLTRWCGGGGRVFDRAGKMSSKGAAMAIHGHGIFQLAPPAPVVNHFADYNHVLVHYCSSDNWIGSAGLSGINTSTGTGYDITFQGEAIVNAVIGTLLAGPVAADPAAVAEFYGTTVPDLRDAVEIVLAGESAGGGGLRHHLDRLNFDVLQPAVVDPEVKIVGVVDAGATPGLWDAGISWADPFSPADYRDYLKTEVEPPVRSFWGANDSALDQSCLEVGYAAQHNAVGSHPQVCYDTTYTLMNHITTPVFLRHDIDDPLGKDRYLLWVLYPTLDAYWSAQFAQLTLFSTYDFGIGGLQKPDGASGVQGVHCDRHVAIQADDGFFAHRVTGPAVPQRSFHDLLTAWLGGAIKGMDTVQIQADNLGSGAYSASICP